MAEPFTLAVLSASKLAFETAGSISAYLAQEEAIEAEKEAIKRKSEGTVKLMELRAKNRTRDMIQRTGTITLLASSKNVTGTSVQAAKSVLLTSITDNESFDLEAVGEQLKTARLRVAGLDKVSDMALLNTILGSASGISEFAETGIRTENFKG